MVAGPVDRCGPSGLGEVPDCAGNPSAGGEGELALRVLRAKLLARARQRLPIRARV